MVRKKINPKVLELLAEVETQAKKRIDIISSQHTSKAERQRAEIEYATYMDVITRLTNVFDVQNTAYQLNKQKEQAETELRYDDRKWLPGLFFNDYQDYGHSLNRKYLYGFTFFAGPQEYRAYYLWNGRHWIRGTITKYHSSRETKGSTISKYEQQRYWSFLDKQQEVKECLEHAARFLLSLQELPKFEEFQVEDIKREENVWTGSSYGYAYHFRVPGFEQTFTMKYDLDYQKFSDLSTDYTFNKSTRSLDLQGLLKFPVKDLGLILAHYLERNMA